ncbi:MAG: hypothetical protein V4707_08800 [Pseudomonadota bacterium]
MFNVLTRLPGIAVLFFIFPKMKNELGLDDFGEGLAAVALAAIVAFPLTGLNAATRRLIAFPHASGDQAAQADSFVSALISSAIFATSSGVVAIISGFILHYKPEQLYCCAIIAAISYTNVIDNIRLAFNEHYVTAALQLLFQAATFGVMLLVDFGSIGVVLSFVLLSAHTLAASLVTGAVLVVQRPYLLSGKPRSLRECFRSGMLNGSSDTLVVGALNVAVVWLGAQSGPQAAAWLGTLSRVFQLALLPVMLMVVPLTSFISSRWALLSAHGRRTMNLALALLAGTVGMGAAIGIYFGARFYSVRILETPQFGGQLLYLCLTFAFSAVVLQRFYSLMVYSIERGSHYAIISTIAGVSAIAALLGVGAVQSSEAALTALCCLLGGVLVGGTVLDVLRRGRKLALE